MELWVAAACGSAVFAGVTSILAKCGIEHTNSDVATALRTTVVLAFAWIMTALTNPQLGEALGAISLRSYLFLALSGLATGASWIFYFRALATGDVNKVVPIDKSSTALSVLLAIALFGETSHLAVKLVSTVVILGGTLLMVERRKTADGDATAELRAQGDARGMHAHLDRSITYAILAAVFAALTSVLAKVGIQAVGSNLATALRTCVVFVMAWGIVFARGKAGELRQVAPRELGFLAASGVVTGASWLCYYYAIQAGQVSVTVQIDKLSILVSIAFSRAVFGERLSRRAALGLALIVAGTLAMSAWS